MVSRFHRTPEHNGQTDRIAISVSHVSIKIGLFELGNAVNRYVIAVNISVVVLELVSVRKFRVLD